jgi:hypothetical protein
MNSIIQSSPLPEGYLVRIVRGFLLLTVGFVIGLIVASAGLLVFPISQTASDTTTQPSMEQGYLSDSNDGHAIIDSLFPQSGTKTRITIPATRRYYTWRLPVLDNAWLHTDMQTTIMNHQTNPLTLTVNIENGSDAAEIDISDDFYPQREERDNIHEYILRGGRTYIITVSYSGTQTGEIVFEFENNQRAIDCIMLVDTIGGAGTDILRSPRPRSGIIQKVRDGMPVSIIGRVNQWYRIYLPTRGLDDVGYIHTDALEHSPDMPGAHHYEDCEQFFGRN